MKRLFVTSLLAGLAFVGCNPIDAAIDCHSICARYSDCWDANYDVGACEERCRSHSSTDTDYRSSADQCNACIYDRACTAATFDCTLQCVSVVP
jgi:hypothetical protein